MAGALRREVDTEHKDVVKQKDGWIDCTDSSSLILKAEPEHVECWVEEKVEHGSRVDVGVPHHLAGEEGLPGS